MKYILLSSVEPKPWLYRYGTHLPKSPKMSATHY